MNAASRGSLSLCVIEAAAAFLSSSFQKKQGIVKCKEGLRGEGEDGGGEEGRERAVSGAGGGLFFIFYFLRRGRLS